MNLKVNLKSSIGFITKHNPKPKEEKKEIKEK